MDKLGYNVTVEISNVTTQGPPATGKTSVIDLAMGRPPAVERHSTGVAEPPSCSIIVGDDSSEDVEWEELTPDRMLDMVCVKVSTLFLKLCLLFSPKYAIVTCACRARARDRHLGVSSSTVATAASIIHAVQRARLFQATRSRVSVHSFPLGSSPLRLLYKLFAQSVLQGKLFITFTSQC